MGRLRWTHVVYLGCVCALCCGRFGYEGDSSRDGSPPGVVDASSRVDASGTTGMIDAGMVATCGDSCGGTCTDGTCIFSCSTLNCLTEVECPPGIPCEIRCVGANACPGGVRCGDASRCTVSCESQNTCAAGVSCDNAGTCDILCDGQAACAGGIRCNAADQCNVVCNAEFSCGEVLCGPGACDVQCNNADACEGGVDCSAACACDVDCTGTCGPGAQCALGPTCDSAGPACTSAPPECNVCE